VRLKKFSSQTIQKILVPTDGSGYSIRAAEYAISIAKTHNAEIIVLYVVDELIVEKFSQSIEQADIEGELKADGQRNVNYVVGLAEKENVKVSSIVAKGRPFEQITGFAKGLEVDLIVMGTYGRRGAERILLGSVAERVIEYSLCPVLIVK
jgi:nucleotide-binding universal stress UspA family protein